MKTKLAVRRTDSILDELEQQHERIRRRAYDLFLARGGSVGSAVDDWLNAERELSPERAVALRRHNNAFEIEAQLPGVDPKTLDVQVAADDVLIKAETSDGDTVDGDATRQSGSRTLLFRVIHLPERIDPDGVTAKFRNGLLRLTATVASPQATPSARA